MRKRRFVSYLRVSTSHQGEDGHGIAAQRAAVGDYLNRSHGVLVTEFVEVESGRRSDRPELRRALDLCRLRRVSLIVAKVDRLSRSVRFLSEILESDVDVRFADLPQIEGPTGRFLLQSMAAVAELEAGMISQRTRAALAAARGRGRKLGGDRGTTISDEVRALAVEARSTRANDFARRVGDVIQDLRSSGLNSLSELAEALNLRGVVTAQGQTWTHTAVRRVLERARERPWATGPPGDVELGI